MVKQSFSLLSPGVWWAGPQDGVRQSWQIGVCQWLLVRWISQDSRTSWETRLNAGAEEAAVRFCGRVFHWWQPARLVRLSFVWSHQPRIWLQLEESVAVGFILQVVAPITRSSTHPECLARMTSPGSLWSGGMTTTRRFWRSGWSSTTVSQLPSSPTTPPSDCTVKWKPTSLRTRFLQTFQKSSAEQKVRDI